MPERVNRLPAQRGSSDSGNPPTADAGLPRWLTDNPPANAEGASSVPELRRSPGLGNGNPLQYFYLGNPMDRAVWRAAVHWIAKESDTT